MAGDLEAVVRQMFAAFDRQDWDGALRTVGDEVQAVDEVSRRWMRSPADVEAYFRQLEGAIEDIHSELRDVRETVWGDVGLVTCWLEQDYTLQGERQHVSSPTTVVLRRQGDWRIELFHSIPLPESAGA